MRLIRAFFMALSTFSIVPVRFQHVKWDDNAIRYLLTFYPIIGLLLGIVWWGMGWLFQYHAFYPWIGGALLLAAPHVFSGFLHLDGFMDVMDAALSHRNREEKLRILKDSHTGAFAVISLGLLLVLSFGCMVTFLEKDKNPLLLLFLPVISRSLCGLLLLCGKTLPTSSMGSYFKTGAGKPQVVVLVLMLLIGITGTCWLASGVWTAVGQLAAFGVMAWICRRQFGGVSGDVAGCCLVVCEGAGMLIAAL